MAVMEFGEEPRARKRRPLVDALDQAATYSYSGPGLSGMQTSTAQRRTPAPETTTPAPPTTSGGVGYGPDGRPLPKAHFDPISAKTPPTGPLVKGIPGTPRTYFDPATAGDEPDALVSGLAGLPRVPQIPDTRTLANMPPGVDPDKWLSGHISPKYAWKEVGSAYDLSTAGGRNAALERLKKLYPQYFANAAWDGTDILTIGGTPHADFNGLTRFDVIKDVDGAATVRWGTPEQDALNRQAVAQQQAAAQGGVIRYVQAPNGTIYPASAFPNGLPAGYRPLQTGAQGFSGVPGIQTSGDPFGLNPNVPNQYTDPYTNLMEQFAKMRIDDLLAPVNDEARDSLAGLLQQRFSQLAAPGSGANPAATDLDALMQSVIGNLTGTPYSDTEEAQLKSGAMNSIERQRAADRQRVMEIASQRGLDPSSGPILRMLQEVDENAARLRTEAETKFATKAIDERRGRLGDAIDFATGRRDVQERELDRGDSRMREALALAAQLADLSAGVRGEREGRVDQAGALVSLLMELDDRAFNRSLAAQGLAPSLTQIFQNMLGLSNTQQQATQYGQQQSNQSMAGLMEMIGYMMGGS